MFCMILAAGCTFASDYQFAKISEGRVRYQNWGKGEKALVFVHGWTCAGSFWDANVAGLRDHWRVVTVDLPGHGGSDKPEVSYTMELFAKDVEAVMHDAGIKEAVLIGHSMGAPVIRQIYADSPTQIAGLVIVDGTVAAKGSPRPDRTALFREMRSDYDASVTKTVESMFSAHTSPELRKEILAQMLSTPHNVGISAREALYSTRVWDNAPVQVPTLAIYKGPRTYTVMRAQFPNLEFEAWEGYGHFLMMEDPARFNARLRAFLTKIGF